MNDSLIFKVDLPLPYDRAMQAVEDAFKTEGFGILTHVDARATFKQKLDAEFRPFSILGVCKPTLAHRLLSAEPKMGLQLPCKVTVEAAEGGGSTVRIINPQVLVVLEIGEAPEIKPVADEAEGSVRRVVEILENIEG